MDLSKYQIPCAECRIVPELQTAEDAPYGYKVLRCAKCGKETCIDTNEVVVWHSWYSKNFKPLPKFGVPVNALLRHFHTGGTQHALLVRVDESDCVWRTADDHSELSFDWDVVSWEYTTDAYLSYPR